MALINKRLLYSKLAEVYNKGLISWGANEIFKDIIAECDSDEERLKDIKEYIVEFNN